MDLINFKNQDQAVKITTMLAITFCVIMAIAFVVSFFYMTNKIDAAYTKALVLDTSGKVYNVTSIATSDMRKFEYENHIRTFISKWYEFDEETYENNIVSGLNLIGNKGKELLSEYNDINMLNSLVQKNLRYGVSITELEINMSTIPVSGLVKFTQTGYRARGTLARDVMVDFTLYDVSRSRDNSHGVKIEEWQVHYSQPREVGEPEETK